MISHFCISDRSSLSDLTKTAAIVRRTPEKLCVLDGMSVALYEIDMAWQETFTDSDEAGTFTAT